MSDAQQPQTPQDGAAGAPAEDKPDPRKASAKQDFEIGLSLRVIGAKVGVSEAAIRLWAKEGNWTRGGRNRSYKPVPPKRPIEPVPTLAVAGVEDVTDVAVKGEEVAATAQSTSQNCPCEVAEGPECEVRSAGCEVSGQEEPLDVRFRQRVRNLLENPTPDEAVDVAARAVVQVVHGHRAGIMRAQALCDKLLTQLDVASDCRDLLEEFITSTTEPGKYRSMLMRLVSLEAHAGTMRNLATAMSKLVQLERQAFGLGQADDPTPPPPPPTVERVEDKAFDAIRERVQARLAPPKESTP